MSRLATGAAGMPVTSRTSLDGWPSPPRPGNHVPGAADGPRFRLPRAAHPAAQEPADPALRAAARGRGGCVDHRRLPRPSGRSLLPGPPEGARRLSGALRLHLGRVPPCPAASGGCPAAMVHQPQAHPASLPGRQPLRGVAARRLGPLSRNGSCPRSRSTCGGWRRSRMPLGPSASVSALTACSAPTVEGCLGAGVTAGSHSRGEPLPDGMSPASGALGPPSRVCRGIIAAGHPLVQRPHGLRRRVGPLGTCVRRQDGATLWRDRRLSPGGPGRLPRSGPLRREWRSGRPRVGELVVAARSGRLAGDGGCARRWTIPAEPPAGAYRPRGCHSVSPTPAR